MLTSEAQNLVAAAVAARGYREGWTAEQFAARQVAKMVEELGEMEDSFRGEPFEGFYENIWVPMYAARRYFDDTASWQDVTLSDPSAAYAELCDVVVVALTMAGALSEIIGQPLDVVADAVAKATQDIPRGTRA